MYSIKKHNAIIAAIIAIICIAGSTALSVNIYRDALVSNIENENRVVAGLINGVVENSFLKPITTAETISKDITTINILNVENENQAKAKEGSAIAHLKTMRDGLGYSIVFAVSDKGKAYYTPEGISHYVSRDSGELDAWYYDFAKDRPRYQLDVDNDAAANWGLSIFINCSVYDADNQFIGVSGVGVDMSDLQNVLQRYERIYDVKINLIDSEGLIQVDTDTSKIENEYIKIDNLSDYNDGAVYYELLENGSRNIIYMSALDWYLVVTNNSSVNQSILNAMVPIIGLWIICIAVIFAVIKMGIIKNKPKEDDTEQEK